MLQVLLLYRLKNSIPHCILLSETNLLVNFCTLFVRSVFCALFDSFWLFLVANLRFENGICLLRGIL
ncbi:hypothetical protein SDJN02_08475 [Cucurbita argyrosperma subsp. argyrosperma]|nr:hypothetical protein SDJN02_08475 [Cucurbita argyrosperma subsp. argyrosperma]